MTLAQAIKKAEWKVEDMMRLAQCDRDTAVAYLEAEEWYVSDALTSLRGDRNDSAALLTLAQAIHGAVICATEPHRESMGRNTYQEAFRAEAIKRGVENKSWQMGMVVAKCMTLSGYAG